MYKNWDGGGGSLCSSFFRPFLCAFLSSNMVVFALYLFVSGIDGRAVDGWREMKESKNRSSFACHSRCFILQ